MTHSTYRARQAMLMRKKPPPGAAAPSPLSQRPSSPLQSQCDGLTCTLGTSPATSAATATATKGAQRCLVGLVAPCSACQLSASCDHDAPQQRLAAMRWVRRGCAPVLLRRRHGARGRLVLRRVRGQAQEKRQPLRGVPCGGGGPAQSGVPGASEGASQGPGQGPRSIDAVGACGLRAVEHGDHVWQPGSAV